MAGKICHIELKVKDMGAAKKFYGDIFGWTFHDFSGEYAMFDPGEGIGGALELASDTAPDGAVRFYIEVDDIESSLAGITEAGGHIEKEKSEIGGSFGHYAHFRDNTGNLLGLWSK
ncbi:MAG: VOC family protein [Planctomycetota bacterium]|jgi:predicted enzyme related to lactoylglutathione lyase